MIFLVALVPATMLTIAGYAVLYLAHRSDGGLKSFGRYLGFWAFTLAALVLLGSFLAAARGARMHEMMMQGYAGGEMHRQCPGMSPWHHPPMGGEPQAMPGVPAAAPPGATPPK